VDRRSRRVTAFEPFGSSAVPLQSDPMASWRSTHSRCASQGEKKLKA
jgi:hypothetical protein